MKRLVRLALPAVAVLGLSLSVESARAAQSGSVAAQPDAAASSATYTSRDPRAVQLADQSGAQTRAQTATIPMGTIRLRVIPRIGAKTPLTPRRWEVMTYGRDAAGRRQKVTEVVGPTPELELPAGWYLVRAHMADKTIRHPVEVTAGRTFKYTLVEQ